MNAVNNAIKQINRSTALLKTRNHWASENWKDTQRCSNDRQR